MVFDWSFCKVYASDKDNNNLFLQMQASEHEQSSWENL